METSPTPSIVETPLAHVERVAPRLVEIRFKHTVFIDAMGIAQIFEERKRLQGNDAVAVFMSIPADAELDLAVLGKDHFQANDGADGLIAMATVAQSSMNEMLAKLFFAYFPQGFPSQVFTEADQARAWLRERLR